MFKKLYNHLCGDIPDGTPPWGTRDMRIMLLQKWGEGAGPFLAHPSMLLSTEKLANWIIDSNNGTNPTPGHAFERFTGLSSLYLFHLKPADRVNAKSLEVWEIAQNVLIGLAELIGGDDWKNKYRVLASKHNKKRPQKTLSAIFDGLSHKIQESITTIEVAGHAEPLVVDSGSDIDAIEMFWEEAVHPNIEEITVIFNKICPPSKIATAAAASAGASGSDASKLDKFAEALATNTAANCMANAELADATMTKDTAAGSAVPRSKAIAVSKGSGKFAPHTPLTQVNTLVRQAHTQTSQSIITLHNTV